ncbi:MAG TPA: DivIVA domain-containing protein [Pseudonocardiaceae bacterium]|nr:DivIVA domain-containing protein [Pseudonocardiaceae bacterium]
MPLTPADVANVVFSNPPVGERAYHEGEVDTFLDVVHAELTRLIHDNDDLRGRIEYLRQQLTKSPHQPADAQQSAQRPLGEMVTATAQGGTVSAAENDPNLRAAQVLALAQQLADKMTYEATADAEQTLTQAQHTCQQLLSEAKAQADNMITQAGTQAEIMLAEARDKAETLDTQSRDKAAALERQVARQHVEILEPLHQQTTVLEKKIDQLRAFEHDYRTCLTTYLHSQLRQLGNSSPTPPPDPIPSLPALPPSKQPH